MSRYTLSVKQIENNTINGHYICYNNDDKPSMDTWVKFNKEDKAIHVKYKGMLSAIDMVLIRPNM